MAFDRPVRPASHSALRRVWLYCLLLSLPGLLFAGLLLHSQQASPATALLLMCCLLLCLALLAATLVDVIVRPLQTLSNVVASLREGDYSFRVRGAGSQDALGELAAEVNKLADLLQSLRVRSLEATALLTRILEVMSAPLFAFDSNDRLQLANNAALELLGSTHARSIGSNARELGLDGLLAAADQTIHSFGNRPSRWLLRKAAFRQEGAPHILLLLSDVSLSLQEEEQRSWERLIRVLGHELSNSLAPIKSIAGSLLARAQSINGDEGVIHDFRRGLGVIEGRADALHRFVQSYRQLAQLPPPLLRPVPLGALLERVALLEQRLDIQIDSGPPVTLQADPDHLEQMLINLLANAVDASLANDSRPVRASWRTTDSSVSIIIEDSGLGIANAENLFVPFYTTKPTGSGVGLPLAQQIARAHGGEISLVNREDGPGTRATVRLPMAEAGELASTPPK
ncbi:MAG: ATP-binding protein [Terracidiphilus sp.]|jgi:nitrogen fixation/metabolism regulation signal transduction histidine kinase